MADWSGTYYLVNGYRADTSNWAMPSVPVYRLYNDTVSAPYHYWTRDHAEYVRLGSVWTKEGIAFWTGSASNTPLYRLYNPYNYQHMYTMDHDEYETLVAAGWTGEGTAFKVDVIGDWPVYRLYNQYNGEHLFTASTSERATCISNGWTDEGIGFRCYGLPALDVCVDLNPSDYQARSGLFGYADAQLFRLRNDGNGQYALISNYSNLGIGSWGDGTVGELRGSIGDACRYTVTQIGTATVDSQSVSVVRLTNVATGRALALGGNDVGSAATLETVGGGWDQRWALVPRKLLQTRGLYELRLMANASLALDVCQAKPADGTNVMVHQANGGNNQKFYLHDNGNGWSLRDIKSGKMVDVKGASFNEGTNVQIYSDNSSRAQRWRAIEHGTTRIGGTTCQVVSLGAGNATDYLMASEANAQDANVYLGDNVATTHSSWALLPTSATDLNVPAPSDVQLSSALWARDGDVRAYQGRCYPSWICADAWMAGLNSYQLDYKICYMGTYSTTWGPWGESRRVASDFVHSGNTWWYAPGIDTSFDTSRYKAALVAMYVRVQGTSGAESVFGPWTITHLANVIVVPTITLLPECGWSFEGLRIGYRSSHKGGTTYIYVTGVYDDRGNRIFSGTVTGNSGAYDDDGSIVIPWSKISNFNRMRGRKITVQYQVGTELMSRWTYRTWSGATTVSANTGTVNIGNISTRLGSGRTFIITARNLGKAVCSLTSYDGDAVETYGPYSAGNGYSYFVAEPPFIKRGYWISYMTCSTDEDDWAVRLVDVNEINMMPCHAFDWSVGGERHHLLLEVRKDTPLTEVHQIDPDYEDVQLRGRRNRAVTYPGTRSHPIKAEGAFVDEGTETGNGNGMVSALNLLEAAGHVHYRAPSGWDYDVAITNVSWETNSQWAEVTVSMIEETV